MYRLLLRPSSHQLTIFSASRSFNSVYQRTMSNARTEEPKKIAIAQMRSTNDKQHNMNQVRTILQKAQSQQATFVFFPECCDYVGSNREETLKMSEPLTGQTVTEYKQLAKDFNLWISFGGVHESILSDSIDGEMKNIYNTHLVVNNLGDIVGQYRKLHMFNVVTPEFKFRESETVRSGNELVSPINTPIGKLGLQICYDVRFSEASTLLRKQGAEILTYPSAFAVSTGRAHWEVLLRARAIENQCFVIAAAQIGFHNKKRESYGHAMAVDPWGSVLCEAGQQDLDVVVATLDLERQITVRQNMPCFDHRRDDVYNLSYRNGSSQAVISEAECKFGTIDIPCDMVFYSSEYSFAFVNIRCVVPGHVLVSTKRSAARLPDLTAAEINDFFQTVCRVQKVAEKLYNATSSTVTVQDGPEAGQTVNQVHCHVMPRHEGDFPENDQIYGELNRHDKEPDRPKRAPQEMIAEAKRFQQEFLRMGL
ncbi:nitrilase and fragile histidine triad fusion protein NitFhit [Malaya genurostris]|uniref:nitrilase and fragile histidine triad fusion protein NitFhit n=1 Tax=Malaya genurostris TaxID=325434 RepID=UPI0026F3D8BA|nr:nitrilase and fragile histidine triad fusion protein NitFhit [Malaya genurostris]XP_058467029.1 nitrilase and fragile histidine triad fusion protein NitFhit [Malaya genurostris]